MKVKKVKLEDIVETISDFYQKLHSRQLPIFSNKKAKIAGIILMSVVMLLFLFPLFIDSSDLRLQIEQDVSKSFDAELTINSDIEISFLPASILAHNVVLQHYEQNGKTYNVFAKSAKVNISFIDMLFGKIEVKEITLRNAALETYFTLDVPTRNNGFTNGIKKLKERKSSKIKRPKKKNTSKFLSELPIEKLDPSALGHEMAIVFNIENGEFASYDKTGNKTVLKNIFSEVSLSEKALKGYGEFINANIVNRFSFDADFSSGILSHDSYLRLTSEIFDLKIDGKFLSKNKGLLHSDFEGSLKAKIFKLKSFYRSYVGSNRAIYEKLKPGTRVINVSGQIKNKEGESEIKNLSIRSDVINGEGEIRLNLTRKRPILDINLEFEDLNLDNIWSSGSLAFKKDPHHVKKIYHNDETLETIHLSNVARAEDDEILSKRKVNNIDLTSEIKIKKAKYLGGEIKDIDLYLVSSKNDEIMLLPMIFKVPGKGTVRVNGVIYRDDNFPKLIGKVDAVGEDLQSFLNWIKFESQNLKLDHLKQYVLYSDIMLNPNLIKMNNLYLNVNNDESEFLGEITIDDSGKTSKVENKFRVSAFNADNYFLVSGQNVYLSPGRLLQKVLWLNEINSDNIFEVEFEKLTYKGEDFYDQAVKLEFGQGYLNIEDLKLKSDITDLSANISIDISHKEPLFNMSVVANSFSYKSFSDNRLLGTQDKEINAADQFFALPSLEGFKGNISLDIAMLELDSIVMKNAKLEGELQDGRMPNSKVGFNLYDADFIYEGLLGLKHNKTVSGVFGYSHVDLGQLLPNMIMLDNVSGIANIAGKISASASDKEEFLDHISSEIKFNIARPVIKQYGLNDLVNKMFYPRHYRDILKRPEEILFNPKSTTILQTAEGVIKIHRDHSNSIKADFKGPFINGIVSGRTDIVKKDLDAVAKIVFLTGDSKKQFPIHIATSLRGKFDNLSHATNLDQVRHRLGLPKIHQNKAKERPVSTQQQPKVDDTAVREPIGQKRKVEQQIMDAMQDPDAYLQKRHN